MRKLTVVLGCLLLAACGGGEEPARREVLQFNAGQPGMIVDGKPVSRELLAAVARGRALSADDPAQHERVLRELLDYVLLAQAARREGAEADATFAADVEVARLQGVANAMLGWYARRHPISDEALKTEYEAQVAKAGTSSYDFDQLLFDKEADAVAAAGELAGGKAFDKVADAWRARAQQAQAYKGVHLAQLPAPELAQALQALKPGDYVVVQVSKDPVGHKGARLTTQVSLAGRYLVYVPGASSTGISRKLPDTERQRLKEILREVVPADAGVIIRTASEGVKESDIRADVERLQERWTQIEATAAETKGKAAGAAVALYEEPDVLVKVIRDLFNEDFSELVVSGDDAWATINEYVGTVAPELVSKLTRYTAPTGPQGQPGPDVFAVHRIDEQLAKALDRKVWLPSGGTLVIDRTEAMTVVDVNTGKFTGSGGNLEETVTKNNLEAAEEIVRQLRLRDIGGIIVIDFIDMVLESNRDLVVRRLLECLGRDRTKHQVAEVTSLGLVQMTRKRVGSGLIEVFSETCEHCSGRGIIVHSEPIDRPSNGGSQPPAAPGAGSGSRTRGRRGSSTSEAPEPERKQSGPTAAQIAAAAHAAALISSSSLVEDAGEGAEPVDQEQPLDVVRELEGDEPVMAAEAQEPEFHQEVAGAAEAVAAAPEVEAPVMAAEPEEGPEFTAEEPPEVAPPAARGRRRRGRVVAPAGPPRSTTDES